MKVRSLFYALTVALAVVACSKDEPYDPGKDPGKKPGEGQELEYTVDKDGYATYTYEGFTYKFFKGVVGTTDAKAAKAKIESDLKFINENLPEKALKVMKQNPIWLEENNDKSSSAAWCHVSAGSGTAFGGLAAKEFCVEITNYKNYVSWSNQNQPLMVLHELCHLYHSLALGGDSNQDIRKAYDNAKANVDIYTNGRYRTKITDKVGTPTSNVYAMNTMWEYFSEISEAYWGENDYAPFNYEELREKDPMGFQLMESIWGRRTDKE